MHCDLESEGRQRIRAESLLQEQSRILDAFFKHTFTSLAILDREFNFIRVNDAYAKACHRDTASFPGRNHFELYPHAENEAIFRDAVRTKTPYRAVAKPFVFPDHPEWGVTYWDWTLFPILDSLGEVEFLVFSLNDVTATKRNEQELETYRRQLEELVEQRTEELQRQIVQCQRAEESVAKEQANLRAIFDSANVGMLLVDQSGAIKRVNRTITQWIEREIGDSCPQPGDFLGCLQAGNSPDGCGRSHDCSSCSIRNTIRSVLETGQAVHGLETPATLRARGQQVPLWLEISADPLELDGSRHVVLALTNITERKRASEAIERLATFPRFNPNPISEVDLNGQVRFLNPVAQRLFPELETAGLSHPWLADWETAISEIRKRHPLGYVREVNVADKYYLQTVHFVEETQCFRVYGVDITVRKNTEQQLQETADKLQRSNKELEQFAYIASHDLQEPLRVVTGYVQLIERKYRDRLDPEADQFIEYIVDGVSRMQQLIVDLLNYSRVGTRAKPFTLTSTQAIMEQVVANLSRVIAETNATVAYESLPAVQGDATQLVQLFQNLVSNGIKFRGDKSPYIKISAHREDDGWVFSVQDNGIGIDRRYWERIFVIFQRLHARHRYPGTGIGLAICKRIVDRHGGRIWLESQPRKGSTFYFTLRDKP